MHVLTRETGFRFDVASLRMLHATCMANLIGEPGRFRNQEVTVTYSPGLQMKITRDDITEDVIGFMVNLHARWNNTDPFTLAALTLWEISRIHPFLDGNGRTARAAAQHVLFAKLGTWPRGSEPITQQIKIHSADYLKMLRHADMTFKKGQLDLGPLAEFLARMLKAQLQSDRKAQKATFAGRTLKMIPIIAARQIRRWLRHFFTRPARGS